MISPVISSTSYNHANPPADTAIKPDTDSLQVEERRDSFLLPAATMETSKCHVFYVDRRVESNGLVSKTEPVKSVDSEVKANVESLLVTFPTGELTANT
jgi:hypothetical protein